MDTSKRDLIFSRILILGILAILLPWIWDGLVWLWNWYQGYSASDANAWHDLGAFLWRNISVVLILYTIICLQVAGLAEFKFNKNFVPAFFLSLLITPPIMMAVYGRHSEVK